MTTTNANDKLAMLEQLASINQVEGFDPTPFAVDYTDLSTGETRKRLPVMIQIAWFRMKYPQGRISVQVTAEHDCFVATARVYINYQDGPENYLAEATASRGPDASKPSVSPREWAQTAAVGIALRNAGFGLQFHAAGDEFETRAANELGVGENLRPGTLAPVPEPEYTPLELTPEQKLEQAMNTPCPITKYKGKTLGDVLTLDPKALSWVANKFTGDEKIIAAANLICEYAMQQAGA